MRRRVGVTGFGVVSPIGVGRNAFWRALVDGRSGIAPITHFDCSTFAAQLAGEVREEISIPQEVKTVSADDPKVGFAFAACEEALACAGITRLGSDALLHLGTSLENFDLNRAVCDGRLDFAAVAGRCLSGAGKPLQSPLDTATTLISRLLGRPRLALTNCSACAAGAQAIGHGFRNVRNGRFGLAVCGGFDSMINPLGVGGFQLLGALSTNTARGAAACRPFDAYRDGTVLGEGAAVLVLEPLDKARAEGRSILAEVCGCGSTLDAHSLSAPDPRGDGAVRAMIAALDDAGIRPDCVDHINAHGTGTRLNDEIEADAIRQVFRDSWKDIPVSSTKSMTGHMIAAAAAVEAGACLLALQQGVLPPNPSLERVGVGCELNHVRDKAARFDGDYVLSNSFGFGGQNATLIIRKYNGGE
jgi:3-oxoacyl-[acyl-carrier-protein] synthase II